MVLQELKAPLELLVRLGPMVFEVLRESLGPQVPRVILATLEWRAIMVQLVLREQLAPLELKAKLESLVIQALRAEPEQLVREVLVIPALLDRLE